MTAKMKPPMRPEDVTVLQSDIKNHPQFMGHETVYKVHSLAHDITAFIGVHNTALGPALGGTRYKFYADENEAVTDVLRLSEAMTWKNAAAGLNHGGGKTVIIAPQGSTKPSPETLEILATGLNAINKSQPVYFAAEDMNVGEDALNHMAKFTSWVKGATANDADIVGGDPSPLTALGVFECIKVAVKYKLGKDTLQGLNVSLQGLGAVGGDLAKHLFEAGAILSACDIANEPFETLEKKGVRINRVKLDEIYDTPADIFAPNAIGGTLDDDTVHRLHEGGVKIICGAANNQQQDQIGGSQSLLMHELNMLYCPDYIVNAGGVIWVAKVGEDAVKTRHNIRTGIPQRFESILQQSQDNPGTDMATLAAEYARTRVEKAQKE